MSQIPSDLHYTTNHEWLRVDGDGRALVGITDFAQSELGDIVYVELEPVGTEVGKDAVFGTVEAVKTVSELYAPVSGTIAEVNDGIEASPELVNEEPYGKGWMIKLEIEDKTEIDDLLSAEEYGEMIGS